jgi:hypothetical protein
MKMTPCETKFRGIARIDRVTAIFEVWSDGFFPFAKFKVKIVERSDRSFLGVPNVAIRNASTGEPEYISGLGKTADEAMVDTLQRFVKEVEGNLPAKELSEADFVWSACEDF